MKDVRYQVEFFSPWHCGSGLSKGGDADAAVIKDSDGLPYIPGKTVKGLLREAVEIVAPDSCAVRKMFGTPSGNGVKDNIAGCSFFSDAVILEADRSRIVKEKTQAYLFDNMTSTAIDGNGGVVDGSLRTTEVALPCILTGSVKNVPDEFFSQGDSKGLLEKAFGFIKRLGFNRTRGLGRCRFTIVSVEDVTDSGTGLKLTDAQSFHDDGRMTLQFRCTLLSDIILTQSSATDGPQKTLDFIPGSNFWGIAANYIFSSGDKGKAYELLFSGKVKFMDAHPCIDGHRCHRTPATFYYPKDNRIFGTEDKPSRNVHISNRLAGGFIFKDGNGNAVQLKQCRGGYIVAQGGGIINGIDGLEKSFSIKSAWDRERRATAESQIFGYESLKRGCRMSFEVEIDGQSTENAGIVSKALCGERRIGKSKSAQYGSVLIELVDIKNDNCAVSEVAADGIYAVYADSRLMFIDGMGCPNLNPTAKDLGFGNKDAEILPELSQVRTFSYSPYNSTRRTYGMEYCGIEKGSVFIVRSTAAPAGNGWTGICNNEGFGKVLYNPAFLESSEGGLSAFGFVAKDPDMAGGESAEKGTETLVVSSASARKNEDQMSLKIYSIVNGFVAKNGRMFNGVSRSQWGKIRDIASAGGSFDTAWNDILAFIENGIKKTDWLGAPSKALKNFKESVSELDDLHKRMALINLSSVMGKETKKAQL